MKLRASLLSLVLALLFTAGASTQAAAKPVPGIQQTPQYRALLGFDNVLQGRRLVPATPARKAAYRQTLNNKTAAAQKQVKSLFSRRVARVKSRDDAEERAQIRSILSNQKLQVNALKAVQASKVADAQNNYNSAVSRVNLRYAPRLNPLVRQRKILKRKLARTTNPISRDEIQRSIRLVQAKINGIVEAKNVAIQVASTNYQAKVNALNGTFSARIKTVKSRSKGLVVQARLAWKQTYSADYSKLKARRTTEFGLVNGLRTRGSGYISTMPLLWPPV
ncbi:MAG: hypothetical protein WD181_00160 [Solirubrobacterales bacterium]